MVLLGEMRQWVRMRFTFTRPYFGTASSRSKTLAVSRYSGGSSSSPWICARPALRSRFRRRPPGPDLVCSLERVHALGQRALGARPADCVFAGEWGAAGMGGDSTRCSAGVEAENAKNARIHLDLDLSFRSGCGSLSVLPWFAGVFVSNRVVPAEAPRKFPHLPRMSRMPDVPHTGSGPSSTAGWPESRGRRQPRRARPRSGAPRPGRGSSRCRRRPPRRPAARKSARVAPARDPSHADHGDLDPARHRARPARARSPGSPGPTAPRCRRRARARRCPGGAPCP